MAAALAVAEVAAAARAVADLGVGLVTVRGGLRRRWTGAGAQSGRIRGAAERVSAQAGLVEADVVPADRGAVISAGDAALVNPERVSGLVGRGLVGQVPAVLAARAVLAALVPAVSANAEQRVDSAALVPAVSANAGQPVDSGRVAHAAPVPKDLVAMDSHPPTAAN